MIRMMIAVVAGVTILSCGVQEKSGGNLKSFFSEKSENDHSETRDDPRPIYNPGLPSCQTPVEWQVSLCIDAPSVAGKTFSRKNVSDDDECQKIIRQTGGEASCEDRLEFQTDGTVEYLIGGGDIVERACYSQQGGCLAIGNFERGDWNSLPNKSFSINKSGTVVTDNVKDVSYQLEQ